MGFNAVNRELEYRTIEIRFPREVTNYGPEEQEFDAVTMIREIRDRHHEHFKDKPIKERIVYYRKKAHDFRERQEAGPKEKEAS